MKNGETDKIIFITGNLTYGGAPKILVGLANYLSSFYKIKIYNFGIDQHFYAQNSGIDVFTIPFKPRKTIFCKFIGLIFRFFKILRICSKEKPSLLVSFDNTEKLLCVVASKFFRNTKCIISERKDPYHYSSRKRTMYWRYNNADGCVFQTKEARDYFSQSVRNKSVVIPNFIEQNDFLIDSWQNRRDEIAFVGRFDIPAKRPDIAVEAFKVVHELYPNYKLVFYGGGSGIGENIEVIKKLVDDYKINDFVTFAGIVKPVMKYISKAKIFLITSAYEGIPNVLLEALSIGLPCVSTDCSPGGARLLIQNHKNGILVKVNDVKAIADSLIYLINHPDIADEMGHRAKTDMKKYDPAIILPLWKEYIDSIIKRKARCVE